MPAGYIQTPGAAAAQRLDKIFLRLEQDVLQDMARRIKKAGKITSSADWQALRLEMLGNSSQDIAAMISKAAGKSAAEVAKLYADAAQESYVRDAALYSATGKPQTPYKDNGELQQLVMAITEQTSGTIRDITGTTGFMVRGPAGTLQFTSAADYLDDFLDRAEAEVLSGGFDYATAIRRATSELTSSGVRSVDYASGRSSRVDVAVRRAVLTGYGQLTSRVTFSNAQQLGTELFEVSWHPDARPDHQKWQGRVWTRQQLETVCGYGTVAGLCGANCRHVFYPYIKGVSQRQWPDDELARLDAEENKPKSYKGKKFTDYQATQEQRKLETAMRAYRERVAMLETAGGAKDDVATARTKLRALAKQYKDFSAAFGLPEQWERVYTGAR